MFTTNKLAVWGLGCALAMVGMGCHTTPDVGPKTAGEKQEYRAKVLKEKGELTQKGERYVAEGTAMIAKGKTLSEQGQTMEGEKLKIDGEAKVREGQLYIRQANDIVLPDAPDAVAPSTQPSMSSEKPM